VSAAGATDQGSAGRGSAGQGSAGLDGLPSGPGRRGRRSGPRRLLSFGPVLTTPAALWVLALLFVPIAFMLAYSINAIALFPGDPVKFSFSYWQSLSQPGTPYARSMLTSIELAIFVSLACIVLGNPLSYFLALCVRKHRYTLLLVLLAPFLVSFLLRVLAWKVMLDSSGPVNAFVQWIGLRPHGDPIPWLLYSRFAVYLILIYSWLPFAALPMFAVLAVQREAVLEAAIDLGASRWGAFCRVTLPLSLPGVVAALITVFTPTLGEFITPSLVGGLSIYLYGNNIDALFGPDLDWKTGSVLAIILFVVAMAALALIARTRLAKDLER